MNSVTKYVLGIVALAGAIFFSWYFFSVIVYILVAAVISFIGRPIIDLLGRVKIRGYRLPDGLKAGITVIMPMILVDTCIVFTNRVGLLTICSSFLALSLPSSI